MGTENQQAHNSGVMKSPGNPVKSGRAKPDCLLEEGGTGCQGESPSCSSVDQWWW